MYDILNFTSKHKNVMSTTCELFTGLNIIPMKFLPFTTLYIQIEKDNNDVIEVNFESVYSAGNKDLLEDASKITGWYYDVEYNLLVFQDGTINYCYNTSNWNEKKYAWEKKYHKCIPIKSFKRVFTDKVQQICVKFDNVQDSKMASTIVCDPKLIELSVYPPEVLTGLFSTDPKEPFYVEYREYVNFFVKKEYVGIVRDIIDRHNDWPHVTVTFENAIDRAATIELQQQDIDNRTKKYQTFFKQMDNSAAPVEHIAIDHKEAYLKQTNV